VERPTPWHPPPGRWGWDPHHWYSACSRSAGSKFLGSSTRLRSCCVSTAAGHAGVQVLQLITRHRAGRRGAVLAWRGSCSGRCACTLLQPGTCLPGRAGTSCGWATRAPHPPSTAAARLSTMRVCCSDERAPTALVRQPPNVLPCILEDAGPYAMLARLPVTPGTPAMWPDAVQPARIEGVRMDATMDVTTPRIHRSIPRYCQGPTLLPAQEMIGSARAQGHTSKLQLQQRTFAWCMVIAIPPPQLRTASVINYLCVHPPDRSLLPRHFFAKQTEDRSARL
jgi:hypothetical protein